MTQTIVPVTLRDVYASTGEYSAKLLIRPNISIGIQEFSVTMKDSDGRQMPIEAKRWGTKLNLNFSITEHVPDGVAVIEVRLVGRDKTYVERVECWVIK